MDNLSRGACFIKSFSDLQELGNVKKEDKKEFKILLNDLQKILGSGNVNSKFSQESLNQLNNELIHYISIVGVKDSKTTALFRKVFGMSKKNEQSLELIKHINKLTKEDKIQKEIKFREFGEKINTLTPEEAKQYARKFIMDTAKGLNGVMPASIGSVIENLKVYTNESLTKSILEADNLFSSFERKTGTLEETPNPTIAEQVSGKLELVKKSETSKIKPDSDLSGTVSKLREQRLFRLQNLKDVYESIKNDPDQKTNAKFFPPTTAWYVGGCKPGKGVPFELEMQEIGSKYGISIIADSTNEDFPGLDGVLTLDDSLEAAYPQDFVDFSKNEVRVPLLPDPKYGDIIMDSVRKARINRSFDWSKFEFDGGSRGNILASPSHQNIGWVGQVWNNNQALKGIAIASALEVQPIMNLTYSESGNTLAGTRDDGRPFIIIGQDSYEASKALMEQDLGRVMTDKEVRMAFAIDYGVKIDDLHFVEQPGDFHLDMNMAIIGPNTIVVNDAIEAANDFEEDLEKYLKTQGITSKEAIDQCKQAMYKPAIVKKCFEDKAATDLEKQGFQVVRIGGSFAHRMPCSPGKEVMNFFNMVTATAPNGKKIVVAMGVTEDKYKRKFIEMMGDSIDFEIYFLTTKNTQDSLALHGGISCRTKTI